MTRHAPAIDEGYPSKPLLKRIADSSAPYLYSAPSLVLIAGETAEWTSSSHLIARRG